MDFVKKIFKAIREDFAKFVKIHIDSQAKLFEKLGDINKTFANKETKIVIKHPDIHIPEIKIPEIKIPDIIVPEIKIPDITAAQVNIPPITIPQIKLPVINVPKADPVIVKIPEIKIPKTEVKFPDEMKVKGLKEYFQGIVETLKKLKPYSIFSEVDHNKPVPVILVDRKGSSYKAGGGAVFAGGGAQGGVSGGATEEKQDDIILAIEGIGVLAEWLNEMGTDLDDVVYLYKGYKKVGTNDWRIMRQSWTDFSISWASGNSDPNTAWTNRSSQSFGNL